MKEELKGFHKYFQETFSQRILEVHLNLMFARKQSFIGSKCLNFNIKTVTCCIKIPRTLEVVKPYIENIMYETVIPIMMVSQKD